MVNNKNKTLGIVLGVFALVIVTTAASFAFFTYSRTGTTTTTVTSGDIEFSYSEGDSASLANAFPVSDTVGAQDTTEEYTFTVNMKSSSSANKMNYNVYLMDANDQTGVNYFTNEQIKFALVKNGTYVAETSSSAGKKLSEVAGFTTGSYEGEGLVLQDQEITSNVTDTYKLRIWISDEVNYSNTVSGQDNQISTGKYNGYKYSLKVKVTSGVDSSSSTVVNTPTVNNLTMTTEISDPNGLSAYAVTTSSEAPAENSNEWINVSGSAKGNVLRTSTITTKTITFKAKKNGIHYIHVKNSLGKITSKTFTINVEGENAATKIMKSSGLYKYTHDAIGQQNFSTTEYRYTSHSNYISFNDELWRIIGVFDVDNGSGKVEKRLKIVRSEALPTSVEWSSYSANTNNGAGVNEWSTSYMMNLLNFGDYYNRTNSFSSTGLTNDAKELISDAKWYLGAGNTTSVSLEEMYIIERGSETGAQCRYGEQCTDTTPRTTSWVGKVGLISPSDYGYSNVDSDLCSDTNMILGNNNCGTSSYLYDGVYPYTGLPQWTMIPYSSSTSNALVYVIDGSGNLTTSESSYSGMDMSTRPATYLSYDVKILDGDGTKTNPYIVSK